MLSPTSSAAHPYANAYERADVDSSLRADSSTRAKFSLNDASFDSDAAATRANDAARTAAIAQMTKVDTSIPDPVHMLALLGATNGPTAAGGVASSPMAMALMGDIALASGAGALSATQRAALQAQYAQVQAQVTTTVNATGQAQVAADRQRDSDTGDNAQTADDRRSTLTRDAPQPAQIVHGDPQEQLVTTTKMVTVDVGAAPAKPPSSIAVTHELHVGTDSYEPVAVRQMQTRFTQPAEIARVEAQSTTHRIAIAHVTQVVQISQAAQTQQLSVVA